MPESVIASWFTRGESPAFTFPSPVLPGDPLVRVIGRLAQLSRLEWRALASFGRRNRRAVLAWSETVDSEETTQDAAFRLLAWLCSQPIGRGDVQAHCLRHGGRDALAAVLGGALAIGWPDLPEDLRAQLWQPFRLAGLEDA
jgi:hypothetical protein